MENIYVAKLGKTVGLKGLLKLHIDSDFPEQFKKGVSFFTNKKQTLTIESVNLNNNTIKFKDINSIEEATKYINSQLLTTLEQTKENCTLKEKQYFWFDLENSEIFENDESLGTIIDIHRYPVDDYFEIKTNEKLLNEDFKVKTFLLPYNDNYILDVNIKDKIINVKNAKDILLNS